MLKDLVKKVAVYVSPFIAHFYWGMKLLDKLEMNKWHVLYYILDDCFKNTKDRKNVVIILSRNHAYITSGDSNLHEEVVVVKKRRKMKIEIQAYTSTPIPKEDGHVRKILKKCVVLVTWRMIRWSKQVWWPRLSSASRKFLYLCLPRTFLYLWLQHRWVMKLVYCLVVRPIKSVLVEESIFRTVKG